MGGLTALGGCGEETGPDDAVATDPSLVGARADYRFHCGSCHGKFGRGAKHLYPPLVGPSWVTLDPEVPIRIVLHGLEGPLEVGGDKYLNTMPPLGHRLSDEQIAGILTYVRASWGNAAPAIGPEQVAEVRARLASRKTMWTQKELEPLLGGVSP